MVKLNWTRGASLGLASTYLGIMGFIQVIFMVIATYGMQIGSRPVIIIVPIGVIIASYYSVIILFEANTSMTQFRNTHKYKKKTKKRSPKKKIMDYISVLWKNPFIKPVFYIILVFSAFFGLSYLIFNIFVDDKSILFVIAENFGGWASLFFANYIERTTGKKTR
ncbi:MAG: hypothetical protein ACTSYI_13110 [Promethearchaeota archaeon]